MKDICIVTDGSAQFPKPNFPGCDLLTVMPFDLHFDGEPVINQTNIKANQLPKLASEHQSYELAAPDVNTYHRIFLQLSHQYKTVFTILLSSRINNAYAHALEAADSLKGKVNVQVVDSKTTSAGLGLLAQKVIEAAVAEKSLEQIERIIRRMIPRLYTLICTPSLSYLHHNGFVELDQSIVSEMLGIIPIYTLDEGRLSAIEKVRNMHQATAYYQEFLEEFDEIEHIALVQSAKPNFGETKAFYDSISLSFPDAIFSKHIMNLPLSLLFGPRSTSLIVLER